MFRDLGPTGRIAAVLALVAAATTLVAGVLFLDDVAALPPGVAADAWRTAAFALVTIAVTAVAIGLLLRALSDRAEQLAFALEEARREREARQRELERVQAIVDSMVDGVIFIDDQDRISLVNKAGRALKNLSGGRGGHVADCHPSASRQVLDRVMLYLRSGDDTGPAHSIIKEKEGRFETTYAPVTDAAGKYLGTVMVIRDIAERRHLENRLLDAERLSGLGQMSAQIAHELRNPLNAIGGAAQYLARRFAKEPDVGEYATLIGEEVARVNRFVADLLKVARPVEPVLAPASLARVLREAAQKAAVARGLPADTVRVDAAGNVPAIDLDASLLTDALINLIQNAFDAGGDPPEVASTFAGEGGEGVVVVEVRDRGCGVPEDQLDEVTRPFVTTKPGGTGLGLVIVRRMAEVHRARFELVRREGGGTIARLHFPLRRVAAAAAAEGAEARDDASAGVPA
ncbi:MAG: PAS domain-containing protein [Holophagales bacterium]|nr:PAS domain-containing protein [Holophagales bacterium]